MEDKLKKFVQDNREAFDDLEPRDGLLQKIRAKQQERTAVKAKMVRFPKKRHWFVAASILLAMSMAYVLYRTTEETSPVNAHKQLVQHTLPKEGEVKSKGEETGSLNVQHEKTGSGKGVVPSIKKRTRKAPARLKPEPEKQEAPSLYARLSDSTSASTRLAAILDIEKSGDMTDDMIERLSGTMNADGNSNVRLAALTLLSQYANERRVTDLFVKSLAIQDDPLVQLGLIHILGKVDNQEIDETLFALANDPETFRAVKDEAYAVLLNQNKL